MALYRLEVKHVGRRDGRSAVAAAAYRSRSTLVDERQGIKFQYVTKTRERLAGTWIIAPYPWALDRAALWNRAEGAEKRKDARTATEILVALPRELSDNQQRALVDTWVRANLLTRGLAADIAIHIPPADDGEEQPHAHVLVSTRTVKLDGLGAKDRATFIDDNAIRVLRESWAGAVNTALEAAGVAARVDHRSRRDRAAELLAHANQADLIGMHDQANLARAQATVLSVPPEPKLGLAAAAMRRRNVPTERAQEVQGVRETRNEALRIFDQLRAILGALARHVGILRLGMELLSSPPPVVHVAEPEGDLADALARIRLDLNPKLPDRYQHPEPD